MGDELSLDNIMSEEDINSLFTDDSSTQESEPVKSEETEHKDNETTEVNVNTLFTDQPESVGSEKTDIEGKGDTDRNPGGTSPKTNFYSSIAKALKEEGIFPDLDDDAANKIVEPEDLAQEIENQIQSRFDERQKRIDDALNAGVESTEIRKYENVLTYLDSIKDSSIEDESEKGETLRKQLIYQDFINKGYSPERATKLVQRSLDSGNDIDDAKDALLSNKDFFKNEYQALIKDAQDEEAKEVQARKEQAAQLKKSILEDAKVFGDVDVDKSTRQKVFDTVSKPIYKDPETGETYTALQKYMIDNRNDFLKNVGLLFTLTDGFKNIDKLVNGRVKKEVKRGLRELENTLNNTTRSSGGALNYLSGVASDPESVFSKGWNLDV